MQDVLWILAICLNRSKERMIYRESIVENPSDTSKALFMESQPLSRRICDPPYTYIDRLVVPCPRERLFSVHRGRCSLLV